MGTKANQPEYTGTWIPKHIMQDGNLSAANKMLYAQVASFEVCYASNGYFAERSGVTERSIQRGLVELENKGYIIRSGDDDTVRVIIALRDKPTTQVVTRDDVNVTPPTTKASSNNKVKNKEEQKTSAKANEDLFFKLVDNLKFERNRIKYSAGRQSKLAARLKSFSADDLYAASQALAASPWHMGSNPTNTKYGTIDFLLRNDEMVERWVNTAFGPGTKSTGQSFTIGGTN